MAGSLQATIIFQDDFSGTNGDPLNPSKWSVSAPAGTSVTIQSNQAQIYSGAQWATGSFTSSTGSRLLSPGSSTTYSLQFREGYTMYGFRHIEIVGSLRQADPGVDHGLERRIRQRVYPPRPPARIPRPSGPGTGSGTRVRTSA